MSTKNPSIIPFVKPSAVDELIVLKQEVDATRQAVDIYFKALSERIGKLIPELPVKPRVKNWRGEVKSWQSWNKTTT